MTKTAKEERRFLTTEEFDLVQQSRRPALAALKDGDLREVLKAVRARRDRARDIATQQRREIRGKALPRGAEAVTEDAGSRRKLDVLAAAVKRLNSENSRRTAKSARAALVGSAREALAMKRGGLKKNTPSYRTASYGMSPLADHKNRLDNNIDEGSFIPQFHQSRGDR